MKIHEYQAKEILKKYGVAVPRGEMAESVAAAEAAARTLFDAGASGVVVKAQIHAGGRGKGGGVKIAKSIEEAADTGRQDFGNDAGYASDRAGGSSCQAIIDRRNVAD